MMERVTRTHPRLRPAGKGVQCHARTGAGAGGEGRDGVCTPAARPRARARAELGGRVMRAEGAASGTVQQHSGPTPLGPALAPTVAGGGGGEGGAPAGEDADALLAVDAGAAGHGAAVQHHLPVSRPHLLPRELLRVGRPAVLLVQRAGLRPHPHHVAEGPLALQPRPARARPRPRPCVSCTLARSLARSLEGTRACPRRQTGEIVGMRARTGARVRSRPHARGRAQRIFRAGAEVPAGLCAWCVCVCVCVYVCVCARARACVCVCV